jgi:hypothetical protein
MASRLRRSSYAWQKWARDRKSCWSSRPVFRDSKQVPLGVGPVVLLFSWEELAPAVYPCDASSRPFPGRFPPVGPLGRWWYLPVSLGGPIFLTFLLRCPRISIGISGRVTSRLNPDSMRTRTGELHPDIIGATQGLQFIISFQQLFHKGEDSFLDMLYSARCTRLTPSSNLQPSRTKNVPISTRLRPARAKSRLSCEMSLN